MTECIFCKIARAEMKAQVIYSDEDVVAFRDINPQAPTHVLVIPRKHIPSIADCAPADLPLLAKLLQTSAKIADMESVRESGYRLVLNAGEDAGQAVDHLHVHVLGGRKMAWPPG